MHVTRLDEQAALGARYPALRSVNEKSNGTLLHSPPRSPSAVRGPQLSRRRGTFVVLLGHSLENGIVGIGNTVENALRAFDLQYLRAFEPQPNGVEMVRRKSWNDRRSVVSRNFHILLNILALSFVLDC
jgi:hypothetical protein